MILSTILVSTLAKVDEVNHKQDELEINPDLMYKSRLKINKDMMKYEIVEECNKSRLYPIQLNRQIDRSVQLEELNMFGQRHVWRVSDPKRQMHLVSGTLDKCPKNLHSLLKLINKLKKMYQTSIQGIQNLRITYQTCMDTFQVYIQMHSLNSGMEHALSLVSSFGLPYRPSVQILAR